MDYREKIDRAFEYYGIDESFRGRSYACADAVARSPELNAAVERLYRRYYLDPITDMSDLRPERAEVAKLIEDGADPFITNLLILLGCETHIENMKRIGLDETQVEIARRRVKNCFEGDIKNRGLPGTRPNILHWAAYYPRAVIIEVGRLQYQYSVTDGKKVIKLHIPSEGGFDEQAIRRSIEDSRAPVEKYFGLKDPPYICGSWLLSPQIRGLVGENSNIRKFQDMFDITEDKDCLADILNFVFKRTECGDFSLLPEDTSLQRKIKARLIAGGGFRLGRGVLKR